MSVLQPNKPHVATIRLEKSDAMVEAIAEQLGWKEGDPPFECPQERVVTIDLPDGPWVQFTYSYLNDQHAGSTPVVFDEVNGCWRTSDDGEQWSDIVVSIEPVQAVPLVVRTCGEIAAFFICGPGPMMDAAEAALRASGVDRDRIHVERFTAGRPSGAAAVEIQALQSRAEGLAMLVTLDGRKRRVAFDAAAGNILDSARRAGLPAPFACKAGVCATCRAKVVSGRAEMAARYGLEDWRPDQIAHFGRVHFGPLAGLAQQYLFAYERKVAK